VFVRLTSPREALRIVPALLALVACVWLVTSAPTEAAPRKPHAGRHKNRSIYWGAWIGDQLTGTAAPWDMGAVERFEQIVGKSTSLVEFSSPFVECAAGACHNFQFPTQQMEAIRQHGSIPVFSWGSEIVPRESASQPGARLADIIDGQYDSYIHEFATAAAAWGHPFFLRFDWEMNGNWLPWSEGVNGNKAGEYVAAWRHVHDIFAAAGASNATWVWCPYADEKDKYPNIRRYYPGSQYVDWTCMDGYNWGQNPVNPEKWKSFGQLFRTTYEQLTQKVAPHKPLMIAEFASTPNGGHKGLWIRHMFAELPRKYPLIRALIWFDTIDRGVDWPIDTSASATKAFSRGIAPPRYVGNAFGQLEERPILPPR
jgi:mannan endo-1,4-beta-mannosidase